MKSLAIMLSLVAASTFAAELKCTTQKVKHENDGSGKNVAMSIKKADVSVSEESLSLTAFDKSGKKVEFDLANGASGKTVEVDFGRRKDSPMEKKGFKAFQASNAVVSDESYGGHFWAYVGTRKSDGTTELRLWSAELSEPDDDTGNQSLGDNTDVLMICK